MALFACGSSNDPDPPAVEQVPSGIVSSLSESPRVTSLTPDQLREVVAAPSGRVRVVNFWATWCGPCVVELPELTAFAEAHPDVDVVLVNVDLPRFKDGKVIPFLEQHGVRHVRAAQLDVPDPAADLPGIVPGWPDAIPYTLVVGRDGTPAARFPRVVTQAELARAIVGVE